MPFYVSPEQQMLDRAEFARKGIARGRSVAVFKAELGIVAVAENRSTTLHKVSEIYDRIAFAAAGRYHEFEALRVAGIRQADLRGYAYDRSDVSARNLAGSYSQLLGSAFASGNDKPFEVDLILAELGGVPSDDVLYRISYDGVISDEDQFAVVGGDAERIAHSFETSFTPTMPLPELLKLAAGVLNPQQPLNAGQLEVALLDRESGRRRTFRRVAVRQIEEHLA
ncbi:proteasome subunit alpha [Tessaracoccus sp. OH4464_COT-324]|uniref:proteasome subunit alpha n=1 Tax=Tessaracoccus sp. OH4464_COT-324 TaxID=2491059 RepID=UPI001F27C660|nr:proteasome subunit alpha [Tessaracoccus sp. OH4464_COT-324]